MKVKEQTARFKEGLVRNYIPERMHPGVIYYLMHGVPPGSFLAAVIRNDLKDACSRADDENKHLLLNYVRFFYNYAPINSWGSPENYKAWLESGGMVKTGITCY